MADQYAEAIPMSDVHIGHQRDPRVLSAKIQMSGLYGSIKGIFGQAFLDLTAPEHRKKAPHQHRPELRGNGTPRKRGKGKR